MPRQRTMRIYACERCGIAVTITGSASKISRLRFCGTSCSAFARQEKRFANLVHKNVVTRGYVYVYQPTHPAANGYGFVAEHRLVAEAMLGRPLRGDEVVHHRNEQRGDNRPENLEAMDRRTHSRMHNTLPEGQWTRLYSCCQRCGRSDVPHASRGVCRNCHYREWYPYRHRMHRL